MNKTKFAWTLMAVGLVAAHSGCRSSNMNPLTWWRPEDPAVLADAGSVPSPSETAAPIEQEGAGQPAASVAMNYPNTGAGAPYTTSPYGGSANAQTAQSTSQTSPYGNTPVGAATPYSQGQGAMGQVQTAGTPAANMGATYAVPSPYSSNPQSAPQANSQAYPGYQATPYQGGQAAQDSQATAYGGSPYGSTYGAGAQANPYGATGAAQTTSPTNPYGTSTTPTSNPYGAGGGSSPYGAANTQASPYNTANPSSTSNPYGAAQSSPYSGASAQPYQGYQTGAPYGATPVSGQTPGAEGASSQPPSYYPAPPATTPYSGAGLPSGASPSGVQQVSATQEPGASYLPGSTARAANLERY